MKHIHFGMWLHIAWCAIASWILEAKESHKHDR